jgi:XTP/dITP diphosphohydrolase
MPVNFDRLVIASHNQGKVREIRELISPLGIAVQSSAELDLPEPEETGATFAENAKLKSYSACQHSGLASLSDDSGLAVDILEGAPGIYSARWAGPNKDFTMAMQRIQDEIQNKTSHDNVSAHFICALSLSLPSGEHHIFEGKVDGTLTFPPRGEKGFGYDPIFIPNGYDITFAEMSPEKKHDISHRADAFQKFMNYLHN